MHLLYLLSLEGALCLLSCFVGFCNLALGAVSLLQDVLKLPGSFRSCCLQVRPCCSLGLLELLLAPSEVSMYCSAVPCMPPE